MVLGDQGHLRTAEPLPNCSLSREALSRLCRSRSKGGWSYELSTEQARGGESSKVVITEGCFCSSE